MTIISLIQINDLNFDRTWTEFLCSATALFVFVINLIFPVAIGILLWVKLERGDPLPELLDFMNIDDLRKIYGTIDVGKINKMYTEKKH